MPGVLETALSALHSGLKAHFASQSTMQDPLPVVRRNDGVLAEVDGIGSVIMFDGTTGDAVEIELSPISWTFNHRVQLQIVVTGKQATRDANLDRLKGLVGDYISANRDLGGLIEQMWPEPGDQDDIKVAGGLQESMKGEIVDIVLQYTVTDPLN